MVLLADGEIALDAETGEFFQHLDLLLEKGISPPGAMRFFYELMRQNLYYGRLPLTVDEAAALLRGAA